MSLKSSKRSYYLKTKDKWKDRAAKRYREDSAYRQRIIEQASKYGKLVRQQLLDAYGRLCECCGETNEEFLTLDHYGACHGRVKGTIKNTKYKRYINGTSEYLRLRRLGWPKEGYRILCMNCNFSLGRRGYCPHQK